MSKDLALRMLALANLRGVSGYIVLVNSSPALYNVNLDGQATLTSATTLDDLEWLRDE